MRKLNHSNRNNRPHWPYKIGLFALLLAGGSMLAFASQKQARELLKNGQILSLEIILEKAKSIKPGRIIETDLDEDDGQYIYEIELLDEQGRIWELELDAKTGELLELENED